MFIDTYPCVLKGGGTVLRAYLNMTHIFMAPSLYLINNITVNIGTFLDINGIKILKEKCDIYEDLKYIMTDYQKLLK